MKYNIAIVDTSGRISEALLSLSQELEAEIFSYSSPVEFAAHLNKKSIPLDKLSSIIICILKPSADVMSNTTYISLANQIKKHSKLSLIPLLMIGTDNDAARNPYRNLYDVYLSAPVKMSELIHAVKELCAAKSRFNRTDTINLKLKSPDKPAEILDKSFESERRIATVLFADISGFTAMSESMDPEEVTGIMNLCFKTLGKCIDNHGGYIDKFIGDCIMAVFGVPKALENAPIQAVNTAIDLRNTIYSFNKSNSLKLPLDIHIGVNTGMVLSGVVGSDQKMEYTVMGDTVNLASRLEDASEKGHILVGAETYRATKSQFDYKELKPLNLKGKLEPVPVYDVISVKEADAVRTIKDKPHDKTGSERVIFSKIVGRNEEMNRLRLHIMKVINGEGGIINVIGEAGIGKSRLMAELLAEPFMNQVNVFEGRSISIGRNLSYYPMIDLLKKMAGITEDDSQANSLAKFEKSIRSVHPSEADEIVPFIATLMGFNLSGRYAERIKGIEGEALENLIRKNIREFLRKNSEIKPLIIYIEDLHWADASTIDLLESLFSLAEKNRIIFLNVFRPGYDETGERIRNTSSAEFTQLYTEIRLEPLDEKESTMLISNLLKIKGLPQTLKEQVTERSGGNPFFIEEVVRSLIDNGAIVLKNGKFATTDSIHDFDIPMTINELLMTRIDRLDEDTRNVVKTASVIGRNFFRKIILQIAENISDIDYRLDYLENIQMIRERNRLDEIEYLFKHALIQETAYQSLLLQKRKELHLQVAGAIEKTFNEKLHEFYGVLSYHYSMAEDRDKAEEYMLKAGEEAMKASAGAEAIEYFKRTLKLYQEKYSEATDTAKFIPLYRNMAEVLNSRGYYVDAIQYFDKVLEFYGFYNPHWGVSKIITIINAIVGGLMILAIPSLRFKKDPPECELDIFSFNQKKMYTLGMIDNKKMILDGMNTKTTITYYDLSKIKNGPFIFTAMSGFYSWLGVSFKMSRRVLNHAKKMISDENSDSMIIFMYHKAMHDSLSGEWQDNAFREDIVDRGASIGELHCGSNYLIFYFCIELEKGNFANARAAINKISSIAEEYDHEVARFVGMEMQMYYFFKLRMLDELIDYNEKNSCITLGEKTDFKMGLLSVQANRAEAYILKGEPDKAREILERIDSYAESTFQAPFFAHYNYTAHIIMELHMFEEAINQNNKDDITRYRKSLNILCRKNEKNSRKNYLSRVESLKLTGSYHWLSGSYKKALAFWRRSIDEGIRLGARLELSRTYFEAGKAMLSLDAPESDAADKKIRKLKNKAEKTIGLTTEECLDRAESMFHEMDLKRDIDQLENLREQMMIRNNLITKSIT